MIRALSCKRSSKTYHSIMERDQREKRITALSAKAAIKLLFKRKVCNHGNQAQQSEDSPLPLPDPSTSTAHAFGIAEAERAVHPLNIDLVLDLIFDKLNKQERLKCRAVDKRWLTLMTAKINKLGNCTDENEWTVVLNSSNILDYVCLVEELEPKMRESLLNVSVVIGGTHRYDQEELNMTMHCLRHLIDLREPNCVHSIAIKFTRQEVTPNWNEIFVVIRYFGPGLRNLSIEDKTTAVALSKMSVVFEPPGRGESEHFLPNLLTFTYSAILKNSLVMAEIVNAAPKLEKLVITIKRLEVRRLTSYANRSNEIRKGFDEIGRNNLKNLKEFTVPLDQDSTYDMLKELALPKLEKLKLMIRRVATDEAAQTLAHFLKNNCPSLQSLQFDFHSNQVDYDQDGFLFPHGSGFPEFPKHLPELPHVKHIGWSANQTIRFATVTRPTGIKLDNFNCWSFPNLNEVTIHAGTFVYTSSHFPVPELNGPFGVGNIAWRDNVAAINNLTLPTVSRLNFVFDTFPERDLTGLEPRMIDFPEVCNQIHCLLPNVKFVFIDNKVTPLVRHVPILKKMIRIFLTEVTGIETLQISNYFQDWLNEFMDDPVVNFGDQRVMTALQGVKTLIFSKIDKSYEDILATMGASIGLRPPEPHRAAFVELVMTRARAQFSPELHHPWEQEFENLLMGVGVQVPTTMIHLHVFMAGEAAELDFDLIDPVLFQLNIGPMNPGNAQAGPTGTGNANPQPGADVVIVGDMMLGDGNMDDLADQVAELNLGNEPNPAPLPLPAARPSFNQLFLEAIERAAKEYPLPEVFSLTHRPFTYTKLDINKYCLRLPALKRLCVHESFLRDNIEHRVRERLRILAWYHPGLKVELI